MNNISDFYATAVVDGVTELDFLNTSFGNNTQVHVTNYYQVEQQDLMRPDKISQKCYGSVYYWWYICVVNGIDNPLTDLQVGQILQVPSLQDLLVLYRQIGVR